MWLRRAAAVFLGFLVFLLLALWGIFAGWMNADLVHPMDTIGGLLEQGYREADIYYLKDNDAFATVGFLILALAGGLTTATLILNGKIDQKMRVVLVYSALFVLVPLSAANFHSQDLFSSRSVQAAMNIPMILLGIFAIIYMFDLKLESREAQVLRIFALAIIVMQAVCLPAIYTVLWWLNYQNAISLSATEAFSPGWISSLSGVLGLVFGVYKFSRETSEKQKPKKPRVWLPGDK